MATETPHKSCSFPILLTFDVSILDLSREENVLQCVQIIMGMHASIFISLVSEPSIGQQVLLVPSALWRPSALRPAGWWQLNLEMLNSHRVRSKWPGAEANKHRNKRLMLWSVERTLGPPYSRGLRHQMSLPVALSHSNHDNNMAELGSKILRHISWKPNLLLWQIFKMFTRAKGRTLCPHLHVFIVKHTHARTTNVM